MPQLVRSSRVACAENSGPPSDVRVVGMPNVAKVSMRVAARPLAPLFARDTTGQPEYSICPPALGMRILGGGRNPHKYAEMGTPTGQVLLRALVAGRVHCYCRLSISLSES